MEKATKGHSRLLYSSILTTLLFILMVFHAGKVQSQIVTVNSVTLNNPPANFCTNTNLTISGTLSMAGFTFVGTSSSISGFNITVVVDYSFSGFGIPTITPFSQVANLGMVPVGTYTVTTVGQMNGNPTSTFSSLLVVGSVGCCPAVASFTTSANSLSACVGDFIVLTNTSVGSNGTQAWYENGALLTNNLNYTTQVITPGSHIYKLVINGATCNDSTTQIIQVHSLPNIDLGLDTTICIGDSVVLDATSANVSYLWQDNSTSSTFVANNAGTYWVSVLGVNACSGVDSMQVDTMGCVSTGIRDLDVNSELQVFPNPTKNTLNILVPVKMTGKKGEVKLFKLDGSLIYDQQILSLDKTIKLTLPGASNGFYLLQLTTVSGKWKSKISIQD